MDKRFSYTFNRVRKIHIIMMNLFDETPEDPQKELLKLHNISTDQVIPTSKRVSVMIIIRKVGKNSTIAMNTMIHMFVQ